MDVWELTEMLGIHEMIYTRHNTTVEVVVVLKLYSRFVRISVAVKFKMFRRRRLQRRIIADCHP